MKILAKANFQFMHALTLCLIMHMLHRSAIDGMSGKNTLKAIASFQQMNGLSPTGELTKETWDALVAKQNKPAFIEYTITDADLKVLTHNQFLLTMLYKQK